MDASILATDGLAELQVPPVTVEVNVVLLDTQAVVIPLKLPAFNAALIVTVLVALTLAQPPVPITV